MLCQDVYYDWWGKISMFSIVLLLSKNEKKTLSFKVKIQKGKTKEALTTKQIRQIKGQFDITTKTYMLVSIIFEDIWVSWKFCNVF